MKKDFKEHTFQQGEFESFLSPSGRFRVDATNVWSKDVNWDFTRVEIFEQGQPDKIFDFFVNHSKLLHGWAQVNDVELLICAEDVYGGQTVVNLTNRTIAGYSPNEDGFICVDFHLSPDKKTLATIGCYWACPFVIKLFDFSDPMNLPLPELKEIPLLDSDEIITGWLDNETLQMKGIERVQEREYDNEGPGFRMKTISETPVERQIKINITERQQNSNTMASACWILEDGRGFASRWTGMACVLALITDELNRIEGAAPFYEYLEYFVYREENGDEYNGYGGFIRGNKNIMFNFDVRNFAPQNRIYFWQATQLALTKLKIQGREEDEGIVSLLATLMDMHKRIRKGEDPMELNHLIVVTPDLHKKLGPGW